MLTCYFDNEKVAESQYLTFRFYCVDLRSPLQGVLPRLILSQRWLVVYGMFSANKKLIWRSDFFSSAMPACECCPFEKLLRHLWSHLVRAI
jgi:hypothetical protein